MNSEKKTVFLVFYKNKLNCYTFITFWIDINSIDHVQNTESILCVVVIK